MQEIEIIFYSQWQSHISTDSDQTLSSNMTSLTRIEMGLSETASRIWEWRGWTGLPAVLTSSPTEHFWDQLGRLCQTDQHKYWGLTYNKYWLKNGMSMCDQHEEELPGYCGSVWFFYTLLWLLFVKLIVLNGRYVLFLQTSIHQTRSRKCCLTEKIWTVFHGYYPHTQFCCSAHKYLFLINVAPFKKENNQGFQQTKILLPRHILTTKK